MNKTIKVLLSISATIAGISGLIKLINTKNDIETNAKNLSIKEAWENISDDVANEYRDLRDKIENAESINNVIDENVHKITNKIKVEMDYDNKISSINKSFNEKIKDIKDSINYDELYSTYSNMPEITVNNFKDSIDYDKKIKNLNKKIEEVKSDYKNSKTLYSIVGDDDSEKKIKKALKEVKEKKINEIKEEINELNDRVKEVGKSAKEEYDKKISDLSNKFEELRSPELTKKHKLIKDIENELNEKVNSSKEDMIRSMNSNDKELYSSLPFYKSKLNKLENQINDKGYDLYLSMSHEQKLGEYLKFRNVPKSVLYLAMIAPLGIIYIFYARYVNKIREILKWM